MSIEQHIVELHASGISRTRAAAILGISRYSLELLVEAIGISWKSRIRGGSYVLDGIKDTLEGHSKRLGISIGGLRCRIKNRSELTAPKITRITHEEARAFTELRRQGVPAWSAAEIVGRPYKSLKNAAVKYCQDYQAVVDSAPRLRRSCEEIAKNRQFLSEKIMSAA